MEILNFFLGKNFFFQIQWLEKMIADDAVSKSYLSGDIHAKYAESRRIGAPDYDMLL